MNHGLRVFAAILIFCVAGAASAQRIARVSVGLTELTGGSPTSGTVEIAAKAPAAGVTVSLISSNPAVTVPATVLVPGGQTSATFPISTVAVPANIAATIKATFGEHSEATNLKLIAPQVTEFSFIPGAVQGGSGSTGTIKLSSPAPAGGMLVHFASNTPNWGGPKEISVPAGSNVGSISFTTIPVGAKQDATVNAYCTGARVPAILTLTPPLLTGFTVLPTSVVGGVRAAATLKLNGPAPNEGVHVELTSDSNTAKFPQTVLIPGGQTTVQFNIDTKSMPDPAIVRIIARAPASSIELALNVTLPKIDTFSLSSGEVSAGKTVSAVVNLNGPAPAGGLSIALECANSAVTLPKNLTVPAGSSSISFVIGTQAVTQGQSVTISASVAGIKPQTASLHISKA